VTIVRAHDFLSWRNESRRLLAADVSPADVHWAGANETLFGGEQTTEAKIGSVASVPKEFLRLAQTAALHRDDDRWNVLYRVLYRLTHSEPSLLKVGIDDDVRRLELMNQAVSRDMHKMTAFVRFRRMENSDPECMVAWYSPDHHVVKAIAPWFSRRFGGVRWSILTPDECAHWDLEKLTFTPGAPRSAAPAGDDMEHLWKDYYGSIFNPARVKVKAMKAEMPVRHWATLPEAEIIPNLLAKANVRVIEMAKNQKSSAAEFVPRTNDLQQLRAAASICRGCELYARATHVVFGEGRPDAKVVMVGEQPGDEEDLKGHPFVGPAGRLLDKAMLEAGLDREQVYVTNAVKHFKWIERGKRRIHAKPSGIEISSCRPWLEAELASIQPELVVCLGATAAQSLMGRDFRVTTERGIFFPHRWAKQLVATIHPSAILRMPDRRDEEYALFVHDLKLIAAKVRELEAASRALS
jgi:probable DNA metabolism protein